MSDKDKHARSSRSINSVDNEVFVFGNQVKFHKGQIKPGIPIGWYLTVLDSVTKTLKGTLRKGFLGWLKQEKALDGLVFHLLTCGPGTFLRLGWPP